MTSSQLRHILSNIESDLSLAMLDDVYSGMRQRFERAEALQELQAGFATDLALNMEDVKRSLSHGYQKLAEAVKQSQVPPLEAEVRELTARAADNQEHGLHQEALEDLLRAEAKSPYDFRLQAWLGAMYLQHMQDPATALTHYEKAVKYAKPRSALATAEAWLGQTRCLEALGNIEGAWHTSWLALECNNTSPLIAYEHAAHCARFSMTDGALKYDHLFDEAEAASTPSASGVEAQSGSVETLRRDALRYLEWAIQQMPLLWNAAQGDERLQTLGKSLQDLLDRLMAEAASTLQSVVARHDQLQQVAAGWQVGAQSLGGSEYAQLEKRLADATSKLGSNHYAELAKSVAEGQMTLNQIVQMLNRRLSEMAGSAHNDAHHAKSDLNKERDVVRYSTKDLKSRGIAAAAMLVGIFLDYKILVLLITSKADRFGSPWLILLLILSLIGAGIVMIILVLQFLLSDRGVYESLKKRNASRKSAFQDEAKLIEAEGRERVLEAQRQALQPFLQG